MSSQSQGFPFQKFCFYDSTHRSEQNTNSFFLAQIIVSNEGSLSTECLDNCSHNDVIMSLLRKRYGTSTVGVVVLLSAAELRSARTDTSKVQESGRAQLVALVVSVTSRTCAVLPLSSFCQSLVSLFL